MVCIAAGLNLYLYIKYAPRWGDCGDVVNYIPQNVGVPSLYKPIKTVTPPRKRGRNCCYFLTRYVTHSNIGEIYVTTSYIAYEKIKPGNQS